MTAVWIALAAVGGGATGAALTIMRIPNIVASWSTAERAKFARTVSALAKD